MGVVVVVPTIAVIVGGAGTGSPTGKVVVTVGAVVVGGGAGSAHSCSVVTPGSSAVPVQGGVSPAGAGVTNAPAVAKTVTAATTGAANRSARPMHSPNTSREPYGTGRPRSEVRSTARRAAATPARPPWQSRRMAQQEKARRFQALHAAEPFVIPNPWDAGSARVLEGLGFQALATTSSGFAFTLGRRDGRATLDEVASHVESLVRATDLPVSVDLENGYAEGPAVAITRIAEAGAVGGSIEDWDAAGGLYELPRAIERIEAAVEAAHGLGWPFTLTARAENHIRGNPDLDDTIARLQAFEQAGADVLYAPGLASTDEIRAVCSAVS